MDSIGIEATSATSGDVHGLSLPAVIGMLVLVLILGIISSRRMLGRGLAVQNLFLKINIKMRGQDYQGFVRGLDGKSINLCLTEAPKKGDELVFDLSSLPDFPGGARTAKAIVTKVKSVSNHHKNFIVQADFVPSEEISAALASYLKQLLA